MGSLFSMLTLGSRSLGVQSAALEVTGNNIANAATEGYHRQSLNMTPAQTINGFGQGSFAGGIRRAYNQFTENQMMMQTSTAAHYKMRSEVLSIANSLVNESSVDGLSGAMDAFYASLSDLSTFPDSGAVRSTILGAAQTVARQFNQLSSGMASLSADMDTQISADVVQINQLTRRIGALNNEIAQAVGRGENPGNMLDQRAAAVAELNGKVNTRVSTEADGQLTVTLGGIELVRGDVTHDLVAAPDADNDDHVGLYVETSGGQLMEVGSSVEAGSIGAALELRDTTLRAYRDELDTLAFDFANRMNEVHSVGYGLDGGTGRAMFDIGGALTGAAASIRVSADVAGKPNAIAAALDPAALPGDHDNALALYATHNELRAGLGDQTFQAYFGTLASQVGVDTQSSQEQYAFEDNQLFEITSLNQSQTGVNIDEEAAQLQKFQAAYQASARFISAIDEMLKILMGM